MCQETLQWWQTWGLTKDLELAKLVLDFIPLLPLSNWGTKTIFDLEAMEEEGLEETTYPKPVLSKLVFWALNTDVHEIYTIKYSHIYIFSLTFMLFCDWLYNICVVGNKDFTCKVGLGQLNQANLHLARHEFKKRPTQLNLSPIGARNQRKFAPNPSLIWIRISACILVSIFGITFGLDIQSRWFKLS